MLIGVLVFTFFCVCILLICACVCDWTIGWFVGSLVGIPWKLQKMARFYFYFIRRLERMRRMWLA